MTRIEELKRTIKELRESGAEQEDIAQVVQELNMELSKAGSTLPFDKRKGGGGKAVRRKKKVVQND